MKSYNPFAILFYWICTILVACTLLYSCNKCQLRDSYTIHVSNSSTPVTLNGSLWLSYDASAVSDRVISNIRASFKEPEQIAVVPGAADYLFVIDSILALSESASVSVMDPCYGECTGLYQQLHPQEEYQYTLYSSTISVYARLIDTLSNATVPYLFVERSAQQLVQPPPEDSTDCNAYEVQGAGYPEAVLSEVGNGAGKSVCLYIRETREPD
jgi:hypothetical protein